MESLSKLHHIHQPLHLSLNHRRPSFPIPFPSLSFRSPPPLPLRISSSSIRALSSSSPSPKNPSFHKPRNTLPPLLQTLNPLFSSLLQTSCIVVAATALLFMRLRHKPAIAAPFAPPAAESASESTTENFSNREKERIIEERLSYNPDDTEALRSLMEVKIEAGKIGEAIQLMDRLIELEPEALEWPMLKAHMYIHNADHELAIDLFEDVLKKDPFRVEAYHGLLMATSELKKPTKDLLKRVEGVIQLCRKQKRKSDIRDFKLLIAQVKVMEGDYSAALKAYQELVKEEPRDFRPYLCQGMIYTLLRKTDEAEKQFEKFRRLVPKNHPYKGYFEDNMFATKFFSQKLEREGAGATS